MPMKSAFPPFQSANPGLPPSEHIFDLLFPVSANKGGSGVALIAQTPRDLRRTGANAGNTGNSHRQEPRRKTMSKQYDRSAEDLGNIVGLEHVTPGRALVIGLGQCFSLWPGASRSM